MNVCKVASRIRLLKYFRVFISHLPFFRLFPPQLIDTQIQRRLEDTFVIFQPLLLSTSRSKRISDVALSTIIHFYPLH